jgi:hypothetical protein
MTIKNYYELNAFEKEGAMQYLRNIGATFGESTDLTTMKKRKVVCFKAISFDLDTMTVEVD